MLSIFHRALCMNEGKFPRMQKKGSLVLGVKPDYLLYLEVSPHWTLVCNVVATPPIIFALQEGSNGEQQRPLGVPPR